MTTAETGAYRRTTLKTIQMMVTRKPNQIASIASCLSRSGVKAGCPRRTGPGTGRGCSAIAPSGSWRSTCRRSGISYRRIARSASRRCSARGGRKARTRSTG